MAYYFPTVLLVTYYKAKGSGNNGTLPNILVLGFSSDGTMSVTLSLNEVMQKGN